MSEGVVEIEIDRLFKLEYGWVIDEFDPSASDWVKIDTLMDEMASNVKVQVGDREVNYDAMPELLRQVMKRLSIHDLPTPQHARESDDKGIWEIDYLVGGLYMTVWYWPNEYWE